MSPDDVDDFARGSLCDNKLAAMDLESGRDVSPQTVIHLAGQAEALYILLSLQSRNLELVKQHRILWQKGAQFFQDAMTGLSFTRSLCY